MSAYRKLNMLSLCQFQLSGNAVISFTRKGSHVAKPLAFCPRPNPTAASRPRELPPNGVAGWHRTERNHVGPGHHQLRRLLSCDVRAFPLEESGSRHGMELQAIPASRKSQRDLPEAGYENPQRKDQPRVDRPVQQKTDREAGEYYLGRPQAPVRSDHMLYQNPDLYDALLPVSENQLNLYVTLAQRYRGAVLELGCGTGQL